MCGTPEEFLAAFRRYVDRHGLFVPTATPAPALHAGRFALTLLDGRILIEGDADVASSSPRPSALYGRTGMILRFTSVDAQSQEVLAALEKAKLSIKSSAVAVTLPTRPSRLREPVVPPVANTTGKIADRTQSLAECVVVGSLSALTPVRVSVGKPASLPPKAGPRFVIPTIQAQPVPAVPRIEPASRPVPAPGVAAKREVPVESTDVGPIVEDAIIHPSGPTLTTMVPSEPSSTPSPAAHVLVSPPVEAEAELTIGGVPPMPAPAAAPRSSNAAIAPSASKFAAPRVDPAAASNGRGSSASIDRGSENATDSSPASKPPRRRSYSQIRSNIAAIAAADAQRRDSGPIAAPVSVRANRVAVEEAVPEAVHDSMYSTEAVPERSELRGTQRERAPRLTGARAATTAASPPPATHTAPLGRRATRPGMLAVDTTSGEDPVRHGALSLASGPNRVALAAPARVQTAEMPALAHSNAPPRLGRSSESVPVVVDEESSDRAPAVPTRISTQTSTATASIRPSASDAANKASPSSASAKSGPLGLREPPTSHLLASTAAAPTAIDDSMYATVPTAVPSAHARSAALALRSMGISVNADGDGDLDEIAEPLVDEKRRDFYDGAHADPAALIDDAEEQPRGLPFSDTTSVSEPLQAVSASRPAITLDPRRAVQRLDLEIGEDETEFIAAADLRSADLASHAGTATSSSPAVADRRAYPRGTTESSRHARELRLATDAKVEIDPTLFAESAIAQSFEANFVLPGNETEQGWQPAPVAWSAPAAAAPTHPGVHGYDYRPPAVNYLAPTHDGAFPIEYHSADETAIVSVPEGRGGRGLVILGSAILVLLIGTGLYVAYFRQAAEPPSHPAVPATSAEHGKPSSPSLIAPRSSDPPHPQVPLGTPRGDGEHGASVADAGQVGVSDTGAVATPAAATAPCNIELKTEPTGASVFVNGKQIGVTPFIAGTQCAESEFTFRKKGFAELTQKISPPASGAPISVSLQALEIEIEITTNLANARVKLNNKDIGKSPAKKMVPVGVPLLLSSSKDGKAASVKVTPSATSNKFELNLKRSSSGRPSRKSTPPTDNTRPNL